jgi:hypothetical protein
VEGIDSKNIKAAFVKRRIHPLSSIRVISAINIFCIHRSQPKLHRLHSLTMVSPIGKLAKRVETMEEDKDIFLREIIAARHAAEADIAIAKEVLQ